MRVAIATDGNEVSMHFGRCPEYTIVDIEDGKLRKRGTVPNPGHHPGAIPQYLHQNGVECIIAGGMGMRAQQFFDQYGIKVLVGISGTIDDVVKRISDGTLKGGESLCSPGSGKNYGLDKTQCDHPHDIHDSEDEEQEN